MDGRIHGDAVLTGGEEAESSLRTFRMLSRKFQRVKWACVFMSCLSMWKAHNWCEFVCRCGSVRVYVWVDAVCAIGFLVLVWRKSPEAHARKLQFEGF